MKKLVLTAVCFLMACSVFAAITMENYKMHCSMLWKSPTQENIATTQAYVDQELPKATTQLDKYRILRIQGEINAAKKLSFEQHKAVMDEKISTAKFPVVSNGFRLSCYYVPKNKTYCQPLYELFKANPQSVKESKGMAGNCALCVGQFEDAAKWFMDSNRIADAASAYCDGNDPIKGFDCIKKIVDSEYNAKAVSQAVTLIERKFIANSKIPASDVKELLQNINRKYSSKMISNPSAWKPVITKVRTMLETF